MNEYDWQFEIELKMKLDGVVSWADKGFIFNDSLIRRVPIRFTEHGELITTELKVDKPGTYYETDVLRCKCRSIALDLIAPYLHTGAKIDLWSGSFIAEGKVTKIAQ